ncbi:hypothetical protein [Micrococcus luteus]|uniref:hypothetical protein n=1 Tax=Micrococcus luteus TaxID=1270 RepID=UPI0011A2DA20|nr:hypothetical protein [Micrococcus luteus]
MNGFDEFILDTGRVLRAIARFVTRYLGAALSLVGGGAVAVAPLFVNEDVDTWIVVVVIVGVLLSAFVAIGQDVLIRSLRADVRAEGEVARDREALAVRDILHKALERLESLRKRAGASNSREKIDGKYESVLETVIGGLKGYFQEPELKVTVNYYRLCKSGDYYSLRVPDSTFEVNRPVLDMCDPEGLEIVSRTLRGESAYCHDIRNRSVPTGVTKERKYRCFASHPAAVDGQIYGMVSMNTPKPGGLNEKRAMSYLMAFGTILASAEAAFGQSSPHTKGQPFCIPAVKGTLTEHGAGEEGLSSTQGDM